MERRRVFVTGLGIVSPHGDSPDDMFRRIGGGESAIRKYHFDREGREADRLVARVEGNPDGEFTPSQKFAIDPAAQIGIVAGNRALADAGLIGRAELLRDAGLYFGASYGATALDEVFENFYARKSKRNKPTVVARTMPNATAAHLSMQHGILGPAYTYSVACASSAIAIGEAFRAVRDGYLEVAVAGGTQATALDAILCGWEAMSVLAKEHPDGPAASVRPFDVARSGFAIGEGAAALILECESRVLARGGTPIAELVGYGASSDAFNITQPLQAGQARCMTAAMADAGIGPEVVGYVNAHATATKVGDVVEIRAIREAFGAHAARLAVSSTKSMHGHLVEAAGALELVVTVLALSTRFLPPTANLTEPDPECDLDLVPRVGRAAADLEYAMSNSFAFGGSNVSLLLKRV